MKRSLYVLCILLITIYSGFGQKLGKPTLTAVAPTADQLKTINEGVKLHDQKQFSEAIAKYKSVLAESPDCPAAMYELALSLYHKGDKLEAMEAAYKGTKYVSDELPLFYVLIANALDDNGKPADAITVYRDGLKLLAGETRFRTYRASISYNLGVTLIRQKKYSEARGVLKTAVEDDPKYPSPHYLLAMVYAGSNYKIPAMLAAARLISLEFNTERTVASASILAETLKPSTKDAKGNMTINLDFGAPKDEGEFAMYEVILPTLMTAKDDRDKGKSENQLFIEAVGSIATMLGDDKKLRETFVGRNYIPFVLELSKNGHLDAFGNIVLFINNRENADARKWIDSNESKIRTFIEWAKAYQPPQK